MARRRTGAGEALYLQQRVEALERRMLAVEASHRALTLPADGERSKSKSQRFATPAEGVRDARVARPADWAEVLATQLVLAGHSRAWVAAYLQETLGVEDPDAILDAISTTSG